MKLTKKTDISAQPIGDIRHITREGCRISAETEALGEFKNFSQILDQKMAELDEIHAQHKQREIPVVAVDLTSEQEAEIDFALGVAYGEIEPPAEKTENYDETSIVPMSFDELVDDESKDDDSAVNDAFDAISFSDDSTWNVADDEENIAQADADDLPKEEIIVPYYDESYASVKNGQWLSYPESDNIEQSQHSVIELDNNPISVENCGFADACEDKIDISDMIDDPFEDEEDVFGFVPPIPDSIKKPILSNIPEI